MPEPVWDALSVFGAVTLIGVALLLVLCLFGWLYETAKARRRERTAKAALTPDCPTLPQRPRPLWEIERDDHMTDMERLAEVAWLRRMYGPPVSPGRDS